MEMFMRSRAHGGMKIRESDTRTSRDREDSVGKGGLGDTVGVWRCQTPAWGRRTACAPRFFARNWRL
jgi:hypothetical protein